MFDYISFLNKNRDGIFVTVDGDKPQARGFKFLFADKNKIYFCTSSEKRACAEMRKNANVLFCAHGEDFEPVVSVHGKAVFVECPDLKARVLNENPDIKSIYGMGNPSFKTLYIDVSEVETFNPSEGQKKYNVK